MYPSDQEWLELLASVTVDRAAAPSGSSKRIGSRLRERQEALRKPLRDEIAQKSLEELLTMPPYGDIAGWKETMRQRAISLKSYEFQSGHRNLQLPGLRKLLETVSEPLRPLVEDLIATKEEKIAEKKRRQEEPQARAAFLAAAQQRLHGLSLAELLQEMSTTKAVEQFRDELEALIGQQIKSLCVTVAHLSERLALSTTTVRRLLDLLGISPTFVDSYTTFSGKDVTAYYYGPAVEVALRLEIDRQEAEQSRAKAARQEQREIENDHLDYQRKAGFRKPTR